VVNVLFASCPAVLPFKDNCGIGAVVIVVLDLKRNPLVMGQVCSVKGIPGEGVIIQRYEPVRMFNDPP
jgi:hypothetical protein